MSDFKISVSLDEVNDPKVDAEIQRQDIATRIAQHQETVRQNSPSYGVMLNAHGGFFRRSIVYMAIFGLVFSLLGWLLGEIPQYHSENHPVIAAWEVIQFIIKKEPNISDRNLITLLTEMKEKSPKLKNNEYLPDKLINMSKNEFEKTIQDAANELAIYEKLWFIILSSFVSMGLAIAEPFVSKNKSLVFKNALIGSGLGALGGLIISLFINRIYQALGGGQAESTILQQIFARAVGWGLLGAFIAIAPGIVMKSGKKFALGLIGGLIGGIIGGILFDPICNIFGTVGFARLINIVGLGVGAAVATAFLENVAKQGWLKVASGLIAGKQFILYRNPTIIGSSPKSEIYLFKDPQISPKHAAINNRNGEFLITSIENSAVFVNDRQILQEKLKTGDRIRIGNTTFIFEAKILKNAARQTP